MDERRAREEIHKIDKSRSSYYAYYTEKKWGRRENYDLCIDIGKTSVPSVVAAVKCLVDGD